VSRRDLKTAHDEVGKGLKTILPENNRLDVTGNADSRAPFEEL
jgi:hypothetical protein